LTGRGQGSQGERFLIAQGVGGGKSWIWEGQRKSQEEEQGVVWIEKRNGRFEKKRDEAGSGGETEKRGAWENRERKDWGPEIV